LLAVRVRLRAAQGRAGDFSVVGPGPLFHHRKTRKIPGGDRLGGGKNGRFRREKLALAGSGKALFLRGLPRKKMGRNAEKPAGGGRFGRISEEKGPYFARKS
jgi:hypothetical protein